jgi:hypothetical protein
MLVFHIFLSNPWKDRIKIKKIRYSMSEQLVKISIILHLIRAFIFIGLAILSLVLYMNGINIFFVKENTFISLLIVFVFLMTYPMYCVFLPKPLHEHLTKIESK